MDNCFWDVVEVFEEQLELVVSDFLLHRVSVEGCRWLMHERSPAGCRDLLVLCRDLVAGLAAFFDLHRLHSNCT
jgi:hypothetical protein